MNLIRNRKIATKLWLMILPIFVALLYILFQFSYQMNQLNKQAEVTYHDTLYINSTLLLKADRDFYKATLAERTLVEAGESIDQSKKDRYIKDYNDNCASINSNIETVMQNIKSNTELYSEFKHSKKQLTMSHLYEQFTNQFKEWQAAYDPSTGKGFIVAKNAMFEGIRDEIKTMSEILDEYSIKSQTDMEKHIKASIREIELLFAIASVLMGAFSLYLVNFIRSNIKALTSNMNSLAANDLSITPHHMNSKDELGTLSQSVTYLIHSLRDITTNILSTSSSLSNSSESMKLTSNEVTNAVVEISKTINEIAEGAANQAEDTQQLSSEINRLGEIVQTSTASTKELSHNATGIMTAIQEGLDTVHHLDEINTKNQTTFQSNFKTIATANQNAAQIVEATAIISDIAEQINLISLNAAIEAARAGEAGRGFSVIADEIHKLSEQAKDSTALIDHMLNEIKHNINTASNQSKEVEQAVLLQTESINVTKSKYDSIVKYINVINSEITSLEKVSLSIDRSRSIISEFSTNVSAISQEYAASTQETSAATQQVLAAMTSINQNSSEIDDQVLDLKKIINKFIL